MSRFNTKLQKWGYAALKNKRWEELRGLLEGWQVRAEGASSLKLAEGDEQALTKAANLVKQALESLDGKVQ